MNLLPYILYNSKIFKLISPVLKICKDSNIFKFFKLYASDASEKFSKVLKIFKIWLRDF